MKDRQIEKRERRREETKILRGFARDVTQRKVEGMKEGAKNRVRQMQCKVIRGRSQVDVRAEWTGNGPRSCRGN